MTTQSTAISAARQFNFAVEKLFDHPVHGQPGLDFARGTKRRERPQLEAAKFSDSWKAPLVQAGIYSKWIISAGREDKVMPLISDKAATPAIIAYCEKTAGAKPFGVLCQRKLDRA